MQCRNVDVYANGLAAQACMIYGMDCRRWMDVWTKYRDRL